MIVSSDGSTRTTLTTSDDAPLSGIDPVWSPDGTKLMVPGLVLYDVATRTKTALSTGDSDPAWAPANGSCTGTIDTVPPLLSVPATINVDATGPLGAAVGYSVTATDAVDPAPTVQCTPPSGSTFSIGDTTMSCTATDNSSNVTAASFTVHVRGASEQLSRLLQRIANDPTIFPPVKAALAAGIRALIQGLNPTRVSQIRTCNGLGVFAAAVQRSRSRSSPLRRGPASS